MYKLLFFWLPTVEMAIDRVAIRVSEGGHNIPKPIIVRRYKRGIENLFKIYIPLCNEWMVFDNSETDAEIIAEGKISGITKVYNDELWKLMQSNIQNNG